MQLPTQPEPLLPPSDVQPLPAPSKGDVPPNSSSATRTISQPEAVQAAATEPTTTGKRYPVIRASYSDPFDEPLPQIGLVPSSQLGSSLPEAATPASPQRLPPTSQPQ
jgi:hypothetical protein